MRSGDVNAIELDLGRLSIAFCLQINSIRVDLLNDSPRFRLAVDDFHIHYVSRRSLEVDNALESIGATPLAINRVCLLEPMAVQVDGG